ncbi:hypothetical protein N7499_003633 [Penicillium canescens]|uniref:Uncharacterized protein n=1 Tax=Penicillium canescens TaxID=5083 RepID=A0AAD6IA36_PENCN|nr:uncharacterized protein N7446_012584 [Penicillium canescens]KAJ6018336.1 hypothetical protein N7522_001800 [Penicillium canescens]KAJ6038771.1 hypothetical protein N7460_007488 [Penicillium canescens]KAJ6045720.1 hypothetical protein N7446_012584 [Penicillium canescens]KAJ6066311.1 hypothetical protein N7444_000064 [Penicillium canescens]KAJ6090919.1 hypothetical protein N7499_003633 [Penicillium canescens]
MFFPVFLTYLLICLQPLVTLAAPQSDAHPITTQPDAHPIMTPWRETFGRPSSFDFHWSFSTAAIGDVRSLTERFQSGAEINVYRAALNANQEVIDVFVAPTGTYSEVIFNVYHNGNIVTHYSLEGQADTSDINSGSEGQFAMIALPDGAQTITIYWRVEQDL